MLRVIMTISYIPLSPYFENVNVTLETTCILTKTFVETMKPAEFEF